jgi:hypothetical protein
MSSSGVLGSCGPGFVARADCPGARQSEQLVSSRYHFQPVLSCRYIGSPGGSFDVPACLHKVFQLAFSRFPLAISGLASSGRPCSPLWRWRRRSQNWPFRESKRFASISVLFGCSGTSYPLHRLGLIVPIYFLEAAFDWTCYTLWLWMRWRKVQLGQSAHFAEVIYIARLTIP